VFVGHICQQSIQKKRQEKEDVQHVYHTYPRWYLFVSPKILKNTGEVRGNRYQTVVVTSETVQYICKICQICYIL
jgi:hypothetical protein